MSESILVSIKKRLGIAEEYTHFDPDVIMDINTVLMILHQMGVGPSTPLTITDASTTWDEFLQDKNDIEAAKTYIAQRVKLMFDTPQNATHVNALNETNKELEWRLYSAPSSGNFIVEEESEDV